MAFLVSKFPTTISAPCMRSHVAGPMAVVARFVPIVLVGVLCLLSGCATLPRDPVPPQLTGTATIPGMTGVRATAGRPSLAMQSDFLQSLQDESATDFPVDANGATRYPYLALSGGGAYGAFGAGFLDGWTATGKRPVFKIVTGVSTGALMAPFAYLGPRYDALLKRIYTTTTRDDIFTPLSPIAALLRRDSFAQSAPLERLIERYVDATVLSEVAQAHRNGRRLYMGTVDLDSRRFVVWNMGLIATHGNAQALELFRKVMLASASIPIAFPPVLMEVEAGGQRYDEMHVDGFVGANVFVNVGVFDTSSIYLAAGRAYAHDDIFVIHNGQLAPPPGPTERSFRGIAGRVIETSGRSTIVGDLFREYAFAQRNGSGFHWVTIEPSVVLGDPLAFNADEMAKLYAEGERAARAGPVWFTLPPGFVGGPPLPGH
ncbi:patatin-like phospholipase family protein [Lysobacter sp. LF1]|uniref:Patatin-like phospholipase family protein n=1 Tax=Lysobacter stagni TaxID=3045172 RepID=A0ABT6XH14_9GAMM|nr:patatin-like phospholipase family protein [Lysobacter sp. LF1]MDI9239441.1 patatin-like phospholipase family protein [Lysobacter sp. LF1]